MSYFPAFFKLDNKKILIVGGGFIAYEKITHLLDFTNDIHVIAKEFSDDMLTTLKKKNISYVCRKYNTGDIEDFAIVVVAVDDIGIQKEIYLESKHYNCLCNSVDSVEYCDFIFPAYIKKGDLTIAVSTSGSSPAMAKYLRKYLSMLIPNHIVEFLKEMRQLRTTLPKGKKRMQMLDKKAKNYMQTWIDIKF